MPGPKILVVRSTHSHSTVPAHLIISSHIVHSLHVVLGVLRVQVVWLHLAVVRRWVILGVIVMGGRVMTVPVDGPVESVVLVLVGVERRRFRRWTAVDHAGGAAVRGDAAGGSVVSLHLRRFFLNVDRGRRHRSGRRRDRSRGGPGGGGRGGLAGLNFGRRCGGALVGLLLHLLTAFGSAVLEPDLQQMSKWW
jgi:uncharacterized membrane protein YgcG